MLPTITRAILCGQQYIRYNHYCNNFITQSSKPGKKLLKKVNNGKAKLDPV